MINQGAYDHAQALLSEVRKTMFGVDEIARFAAIALYTGGHVLLEGNPGLGKTELVKTLARALRLPFGRIQFTPDLMPADITGTYAPDYDDLSKPKMSFQAGPVFTCMLLADEINRATPKTQSAMLEAMAEKQVTVLGERRLLPEPFMVLATQNPIDHEGTYALPKAQADRFMFMLDMPVPGANVLRRIMLKTAGAGTAPPDGTIPSASGGVLPQDMDASLALYRELLALVPTVQPAPSVEIHVANLYLASNGRADEMQDVSDKQREKAKALTGDYLAYGLGPRAATALILGAKAWALFFREDAVGADGEDLARVLLPVLRHRLQLEFGWEESYALRHKLALDTPHLLERLLVEFSESCAPDNWKKGEYTGVLERGLALALQEQVIRF